MECTLCGNKELSRIPAVTDRRMYYHCEQCSLIFVDPSFHLSPDVERLRYEQHNNGIEHPGYVAFLNRAIDPALKFLNRDMIGLDYGCGPAPTLSKLLARVQIHCKDYDPLFGFDHAHTIYDFIFATECFEHFFSPALEFLKIDNLLKPGGYLAIMTERWTDQNTFNTWYYKNDPTHVSFYHTRSFHYLCQQFRYQIEFDDKSRVIILRKT